ncbi:MAG: response regulator transcription factor [Burkholderiales bacterium]|nr:response regulator transcription factor [Burkholderiales bacterium]
MARHPSVQRTAFVVEDDEQIVALLRHILEREGLSVRVAGDGRSAEQLIDTAPPPALVTLDVMLPHLDGFALLSRIRARADWEQVPVVMITGRGEEEDIVRGLDAGASDYVVKPFKPEELRARVRRLLKR